MMKATGCSLASLFFLCLACSLHTLAHAASTPAQDLNQLLADEWSAHLRDDPLAATQAGVRDYDDRLPAVTPADISRRVTQDQEFARRLAAIDRRALGPADQTNYDLFSFIMAHRIALAPYASWRIPLSSDEGFHIEVMRMSVGVAMRGPRDYENYIARLHAVPAYFAQQLANMRQGMADGFTLPAVIVPGIIKVIEGQQYTSAAKSPFYEPFTRFPDTINATERERLRAAGSKTIETDVLPAYRQLLTFFVNDYLPAARKTIGASELPQGKAYYAALVKFFTNLDVTPEEVHRIGLSEVARIRAEMDATIRETGFKGDFAAFLEFLRTDPQFYARTPDELLKDASSIAKQIDGLLPGYFGKLPRLTYSVQPVPAELAPNYTGGRYSPPPIGGTHGGEFWVNTYALEKRPLYALTALALHEAVPGHHLQGALARELTNVPPFRLDFYPHAFGEGWGLYSEKLGVEMGVYKTPYDHFGRLSYEMWRACRLVVDTGMHSMGWSRERALEYLASNTALSAQEVRTETDRYIAWPGQALAYKMGELKILELRARAQKALGERFDLRTFHDAVLDNGGVPLPILERQIDEYIAKSASTPDVAMLRADRPPVNAVWAESIDLSKMTQRRDLPRAGRSIRDLPITLGGVTYPHGIGTRSISEFVIDLHGAATRFESMVGLDDVVKTGVGTVTFEVWADDKLGAASGLMRAGDPPKLLSADLRGARVLTLLLDDGGDTSNDDEGAWAGAMIHMLPGAKSRPVPYVAPQESAPAVAPVRTPREPAIHGARVTGGTPGRPFLVRVPASGAPPLRFTATGLPDGLSINADTGIISGSIRDAGESNVSLKVTSPHGVAERSLTIVGGQDALARTPPMGWNSWNAWGPTVDAEKVLAAAEWLERSGLAAHGFQYVVIDDGWEGTRDANGEIRPNEKFPDMRALADAVHARGLKLGIYSSPGPKTCEGFAGSLQHEQQDAATFARWGIDFLKYDWCSYEEIARDQSLPELQKPYLVMRDALARIDRDIVYSLCQYGFGDVWQWGAAVGGNLWRTSGDLLDMWSNLESVGFRQSGRERWTRPGHWNDTDMLVVGTVGWGPQLHPTRLAPNEQMLHLALWALQAAPLFIGADLSRLDPFTLALLTNDEVLDVDQDPLGHAAARVWKEGRLEIWARPLIDGTTAVGLFNRGLGPATVTARWSDVGVSGTRRVRDLWLRKDLGTFSDTFSATVPRHGVVFVKIGQPRSGTP